MNCPKVSIIIINWNGLEDTIECLESLKKITYPNYEVIVMDNGSDSNDAELLRKKYGDYIHVIENDKNYGFAEGNNIGIRYALESSNPNYILLLNNDTVVAPEFLAELVKVAEGSEKVGIVGPKIYNYSEPNRILSAGSRVNWWTAQSFPIGAGEEDKGQFDKLAEVDYMSGCSLLVRREVIKQIGMLDPIYFVGYEDSDWCIRASKEGFQSVFCPRARIWHKVSASRQKNIKFRVYYHLRNQFIFARRYLSKPQFVFLVFYFLIHLPKYFLEYLIYYRDLTTLRYFVKALLDARQR